MSVCRELCICVWECVQVCERVWVFWGQQASPTQNCPTAVASKISEHVPIKLALNPERKQPRGKLVP